MDSGASNFDFAVSALLEIEGGFVNDPRDPGGATNYGITLAELRQLEGDLNHDGVVDVQDIRVMTPVQAKGFYRQRWDEWGLAGIESSFVARKLFDACVNMGRGQAVTLLQRALVALGASLEDDGQLGPKTVAAVNAAAPAAVLACYKATIAGFYRLLVAEGDAIRPLLPILQGRVSAEEYRRLWQKTERRAYLNGWLNRALRG